MRRPDRDRVRPCYRDSSRTFRGFCPGDLVTQGSRVGIVVARRSRDHSPLVLWWDDLSQHSGAWLTGVQDALCQVGDPRELAG